MLGRNVMKDILGVSCFSVSTVKSHLNLAAAVRSIIVQIIKKMTQYVMTGETVIQKKSSKPSSSGEKKNICTR